MITTQKIKIHNAEVGVFTVGKNASFLFRVLLYWWFVIKFFVW